MMMAQGTPRANFKRDMSAAFSELDITAAQRHILFYRYVSAVDSYERAHCRANFVYTALRAMVTIGSLVTPALLTVQRDATIGVYWLTFALSLVVTIANATTELFSLQKRTRVYWLTFKKLESEGWKYVSSSGKYAGQTHANSFAAFTTNVETMCAAAVSELAASNAPPQLLKAAAAPSMSSHPLDAPTPLPLAEASAAAAAAAEAITGGVSTDSSV